MLFRKYQYVSDSEQVVYVKNDNPFYAENPDYLLTEYTHENIPLDGLVFLFNTDNNSHYYVRQILFYRLKNNILQVTEDNKSVLLAIVPDYFTTNDYPITTLGEHFSSLRNSCFPLIRKFYEMVLSFIRVTNKSILDNYYQDLTMLRNVEDSVILNYLYAFYPVEMTELFSEYVIGEYVDKYYKVKSYYFKKAAEQQIASNSGNYLEGALSDLLQTPAVVDLLKSSYHVVNNNSILVNAVQQLNIPQNVYDGLFLLAFELQNNNV